MAEYVTNQQWPNRDVQYATIIYRTDLRRDVIRRVEADKRLIKHGMDYGSFRHAVDVNLHHALAEFAGNQGIKVLWTRDLAGVGDPQSYNTMLLSWIAYSNSHLTYMVFQGQEAQNVKRVIRDYTKCASLEDRSP